MSIKRTTQKDNWHSKTQFFFKRTGKYLSFYNVEIWENTISLNAT